MRRRRAGEQVFREWIVRFDRDHVLPPEPQGDRRRDRRKAGPSAGCTDSSCRALTKPMPDFRICHAARYQSRLTLAQRVQVFEFARWRPATAEELAAMCAGVGEGAVSVIGIPGHLLKRWWKLAESDAGTRAFEIFGNDIATYFVYKEWPLQAPLLIEVVGSEDEPDKALMQSRDMRLGS